ncbi:30045_t:CDS:1, partial [Racocetra persica]
VSEDAPFTEVEKVYRQLYTQYHTDRGVLDTETKRKFEKVKQAYEKLFSLEQERKGWRKKGKTQEKRLGRDSHLQSEVLETKRVVKVTKGGRRFSFTSLSLLRDEEEKKVSYSYQRGKEMLSSFRKSLREGQRKLISYWSRPPRTVPHDI